MPAYPYHLVQPRYVGGKIVLAIVGLILLALGWRLTGQDQATAVTRAIPAPYATLAIQPVRFTLRVAPGESLHGAMRRVGVSEADAADAARMMGPLDQHGATLQAAISQDPAGQARLIGLSLQTGPATTLSLSRAFDGALHVQTVREDTDAETTVALGRMDGSLYASALRAGADDTVIYSATRLFSHRIDFARDLRQGDRFRLVYDRRVTDSGRTVESGLLRYAEIDNQRGATRLYAFDHNGRIDYFDQSGQAAGGLLLRTPVDGARMTSGFGMRFHPVLGYTRMHQGVDFAAPTGTPVFAAGDGVIAEAHWAGGYGHWLRITHTGGWDTGYGHLSRYAEGIHPGMHVTQGQLVAYVGATGVATGPHLHYEVWFHGERINPIGANVPQGVMLAGAELERFEVQRARIDVMVAAAARHDDGQALASRMTDPTVLGLRPALTGDTAGLPGRAS